jgi:hypothetical protein
MLKNSKRIRMNNKMIHACITIDSKWYRYLHIIIIIIIIIMRISIVLQLNAQHWYYLYGYWDVQGYQVLRSTSSKPEYYYRRFTEIMY